MVLYKRWITIVFLLCSATLVQAQPTQTVEISSSPNPVGSGARALGMGGAFIGVADDATAASWNPAGLIQLETPEFSLVASYNDREEDTTYMAFPEASGPQNVSTSEINYLSIAYPFEALSTNMIVSLNYQHLYDFNKKVTYSYTSTEVVPPLTLDNNIQYSQEGSYRTLTPALAVQVTPFISCGLAVNIWNHGIDDNGWFSNYMSRGSGTFATFPFQVETAIDDQYQMEGFSVDLFDPLHWQNVNFNLGMMWEVNSLLTVGAVFKSPFDIQLDHEQRFVVDLVYPTLPGGVFDVHSDNLTSETVVVEMPSSYGVGLALRLNDSLTFDLDIYRTEWQDYILQDAAGNRMNPITGEAENISSIGPTNQVRFGGEYLFIGNSMVIPARFGIFYDPEPAAGSPDDFYGFSLGAGVVYGSTVFDVAYQYRIGRDVRSVTVGNEDSSQDVDQHTVYMSLIYHF